jgi:Holliday junction resolvase
MARKSNGAFGSSRERAYRDRLEARGYVVTRAAGSQGPADLVACKAGHPTLFVQVKGTARSAFADFGPAARRELLDAAERGGATAQLIWWPADRKPPRILPADTWPPA